MPCGRSPKLISQCKNTMKIFTQDNSWAGAIVVIASNETEARELMKGCYNYDPSVPIKEHEIKKGFRFVNLGDS